jgi:hypothetical protein
MTELCDPRVSDVARGAPFAHVAVRTAAGPHVTPVLYVLTPDRLWFAVPRGTLKARMLAKRPQVGVVLDAGLESVAVTGEAVLLDAIRLRAAVPELLRAPLAFPAYGLRNAAELFGFALDARALPSDLVAMAVRPERVEVLRRPSVEGGAARMELAGVPGVPGELAALAARPGRAVLGWLTSEGPRAVPAAWDPSQLRARVPAAALGDPEDGPVCVCFDLTAGRGPAAKSGLLLRGIGRVERDGDVASVGVELERVTYWKGFQTATANVSASAEARASDEQRVALPAAKPA